MDFIDMLLFGLWFGIGPIIFIHNWLIHSIYIYFRLVFWKLFGNKQIHSCSYCQGHTQSKHLSDIYLCRFKPKYNKKEKYKKIPDGFLFKQNICPLWRERNLFFNN